MANGFMVITDKDWEKATHERRDWMIFNTLQSIDKRLTKLEKRPFIDKAFAFAGGVVGGGLAYLGISFRE